MHCIVFRPTTVRLPVDFGTVHVLERAVSSKLVLLLDSTDFVTLLSCFCPFLLSRSLLWNQSLCELFHDAHCHRYARPVVHANNHSNIIIPSATLVLLSEKTDAVGRLSGILIVMITHQSRHILISLPTKRIFVQKFPNVLHNVYVCLGSQVSNQKPVQTKKTFPSASTNHIHLLFISSQRSLARVCVAVCCPFRNGSLGAVTGQQVTPYSRITGFVQTWLHTLQMKYSPTQHHRLTRHSVQFSL